MGTETALLASVLAEGTTKIFGAAMEPEVDDLILLLTKMGAEISRGEENPREITVEGVEKLTGASHEVIPDRNEAVTFAVSAAATRGDVVIRNLRTGNIIPFLSKLDAMKISYGVSGEDLRVWSANDVSWQAVDVETAAHPGFMTDWQQPFSVLLTQAEGTSTIHETIYPERLDYLYELEKMGANVQVLTPAEAGMAFDPNNYGFATAENAEKGSFSVDAGEPKVVAKINGPTPLRGTDLKISDLRAGATMVIAALTAEGESKVTGIHHIDRGYENFEDKLQSLGAEIERVES
jgi:UDP-N-acetylglucosamine 1-carboxyvinyltransferase